MTGTLPPEVIRTVKATIPVLEDRYVEIVSNFYSTMFHKYPVTASFFNRDRVVSSNAQDQGVPPQIAALGKSVIAYAENIEDLSPVLPYVERICHMHVSRNVRGPHYQIVGQMLLQSMKDVLGDDVCTPEVYNAWQEAYNCLAQTMINIETRIREEAADTTAAGYTGFKLFKIRKVVEHWSNGPKSFWIVPNDGAGIPRHHGGQFVAIDFENIPDIGKGKITAVLSDVSQDHLRVTVFPSAERPTNFLLTNFNDGDTLSVSVPCGAFRIPVEKLKSQDRIIIAGTGEETPAVFAVCNEALQVGLDDVTVVVEKNLSHLAHELCHENVTLTTCEEVAADVLKNMIDPARGRTGLLVTRNLRECVEHLSECFVCPIEL